MLKIQMTETTSPLGKEIENGMLPLVDRRGLGAKGFEFRNFGHLNLFRILDFEFRIWAKNSHIIGWG